MPLFFLHRRAGFSLVELSIVLVILGLLVGGILSGRTLIRASELRSVTVQHHQFLAAAQSFRDKYFYLPGDLPNATQFWGMAASGVGCGSTPSTDAKTCDGDGDWLIETSSGGGQSFEIFRFWQQLANAGLIQGSYTGFGFSIAAVQLADPPGKISKAYWGVYNMPAQTAAATTMFIGKYGNVFEYGALVGSLPPHPASAIVTPAELWNIDKKEDDGLPATGKLVVTASSGTSNCTDTVGNDATNLNANYLLNSTASACAVVYKEQF